MGVAISNWALAKAVSEQGYLGVISGTAVAVVLASRLSLGDPDGSSRRALSHFPYQEPVQRILKKYFVPGGLAEGQPYKRSPMFSLKPSTEINELTIIANFVEVFLAKEGHNNPVGVNFLEKVQLPNTASLYGAMLAGVDVVIMGAGIPFQIPGILDKLANHEEASYRIDVTGTEAGEEHRVYCNPEAVFPGISERIGPLKRPLFFPIISSVVLAMALLKRSTGKINGFIIERPTAGGHNAPPRGAMKLNDQGEPIYGAKDVVNIEKIKKLGLPFWLAGGYGSPDGLCKALAAGAAGIQVGTAFAYCTESGLEKQVKERVIRMAVKGQKVTVRTDPLISPTGFPFKVAELAGTVSETAVYEERQRVCDIGYLRELYLRDNGKVGYRCPSEPVHHYVKKGGQEEATVDRGCLCNNLSGTAGFGQRRKNGYEEPAVVTSGDALTELIDLIPEGQTSYPAKAVLDYLLSGLEDMEQATPLSMTVE